MALSFFPNNPYNLHIVPTVSFHVLRRLWLTPTASKKSVSDEHHQGHPRSIECFEILPRCALVALTVNYSMVQHHLRHHSSFTTVWRISGTRLPHCMADFWHTAALNQAITLPLLLDQFCSFFSKLRVSATVIFALLFN